MPFPRYKKISILKSAPYIPYRKMSSELVTYPKLLLEFERIKNVVKNNSIPIFSYDRSYLLKVAKLFKVKLIFKTDSKDNDNAGFCWLESGRIELYLKKDHYHNKKTLTHELAHILQERLNLYKKTDKTYLSIELKLEQQAETISYFLYKILYPKERITKKDFYCYFKEKDIIWLHNFYKKNNSDYINDIFEFKNNGKKKKRNTTR